MDKDVAEKLERGLARLAQAGDDADALGVALIGLHGALEDHFRALLAASPRLSAEQRAAVQDRRRTQWRELLDLAQLHGDLPAEVRREVLQANLLRQEVAHGGRFRGSRHDLERYAALVKTLCGYSEPHEAPAAEAPAADSPPTGQGRSKAASKAAEKPRAPAAGSEATPTPARRAAPRTASAAANQRRTPPAQPSGGETGSSWPRSSALAALAVLAVLGALACSTLWAAFGANQPNAFQAPSASPAPADAAPAPAPSDPAAPPALPRSAVVGGLNGLTLRVRHEPSLLADPLDVVLAEGERVSVVGGPLDVDGYTWWKVELGDGRQGWCAGEYLSFE